MPFSGGSGGGGAAFNGGTITGATTLAPASNTATALTLTAPVGAAANAAGQLLLNDENGHLIGATDAASDFVWFLNTALGANFIVFAGNIGSQNAALQVTQIGQVLVGTQSTPSGFLVLGSPNSAVPSGDLQAQQLGFWFDSTNGASKFMLKAKQADGAVVAPGLTGRDVATAPAVSAAPTLALGTAYQNTLGYDVLLCVYLSVTVNTSGVLKLGIGPTTTPTQQTLVTGLTATGLWPVPIYLPNSYYALLSVSGTITVAVDGQIAMPI